MMRSKATPAKKIQARLMLMCAASLVGSSMRVLEGAAVGATAVVGDGVLDGAAVGGTAMVGDGVLDGAAVGGTAMVGDEILDGAAVGGTAMVGDVVLDGAGLGAKGKIGARLSWSVEQHVEAHVS
jgi:hypothetical protein